VTVFFQPEYNFFHCSSSIAGCHSFSLPGLFLLLHADNALRAVKNKQAGTRRLLVDRRDISGPTYASIVEQDILARSGQDIL